ncbi:MAG TPA: cyclic nucleotide-binding domain-containing protein [Spirochaetota bacterium]|nr:cyclic nucleotide-binding domain-containing protein [Spirochaetota bacterium]
MKENFIKKIFNIEREEYKPFFLFLIFSFFKGLTIAVLEIAIDSLFVINSNPNSLPYLYIFIAIFTMIAGLIYSFFESRVRPKNLLVFTQIFLFISLIALFILLLFSKILKINEIVIQILMIWKAIIAILSGIVFWSTASLLFNIRQSKRLFGLLSSGEILAFIIAGATIPLIIKIIGGTNNLLIISIIGLFISFLMLSTIKKIYPNKFDIKSENIDIIEKKKENKKPTLFFLKSKYIILFFIVSIISEVSLLVIRYLSIYAVYSNFPQNIFLHLNGEDKISAFFGIYVALIGFANFIMTTFFSGKFISKLGIGFGLLMLPIANFVLTNGTISLNLLIGSSIIIFWSIIAMRFFDEFFRVSLQFPSFNILYQPLPESQKIKVQTIRETFIEPFGDLLAGLIIIISIFYLKFNIFHLLIFLSLLIIIWVFFAILLKNNYIKTIINITNKNKILESSFNFSDKKVLNILKEKIESSNPKEIIFSLKMLLEYSFEIEEYAIKLLNHQDKEILSFVLNIIETKNIIKAKKNVIDIINKNKNPYIKGIAIRTLCALSENIKLEKILKFLNTKSIEMKKEILIGLIKYTGIEGIICAGGYINEFLNSKNYKERISVAQIIGEVNIKNFYQPLIRLLKDKNIKVIKETLNACSKLKNPILIKYIFNKLRYKKIKAFAMAALIEFKDLTVKYFEKNFYKCDFETKNQIVKILGDIKTEESIKLLLKWINTDNQTLRNNIYAALVENNYKIKTEEERKMVYSFIEREITDIFDTNIMINSLDKNHDLLIFALENEIHINKNAILNLLSFLFNSKTIMTVKYSYFSKNEKEQSFAIETLDNILPSNLKRTILPLFEKNINENINGKYIFSSGRNSQILKFNSYKEVLNYILTLNYNTISEWTKSVTIYSINKKDFNDFKDILINILENDNNLIVIETALTKIFENDKNLFLSIVNNNVKIFKNKIIKEIVEYFLKILSQKEVKKMYSTIEKILILKQVDIFLQTPPEYLADIATVIEEIEVSSGEKIMNKGDIGTSMYIIVEGKLKVFDGQKELAILKDKDVVGELSALDPEPRSASVIAIEDSILFKIDKNSLYQIISENVEITKGIIKVLCDRIRKSNAIIFNTNK